MLTIYFLTSNYSRLWVSSDPQELELEGVRCIVTYEIDNSEGQPARDVVVKLLESYTKHPALSPGKFPAERDSMPGWHIAELLAVAFQLGAEWAHDNPNDPSGCILDIVE